MKNLLDKTFAFLFGSTQVSVFQKKTLIINFKKALDNKIRFINLSFFTKISFYVEKVSDTNSPFLNNYQLVMVAEDEKYIERQTVLGHFELSFDAQSALLEIQNKMYGKSLTIVSFLLTVFIAFLILLFVIDYFSSQAGKLMNAKISNEDLTTLIAKEQKRREEFATNYAARISAQTVNKVIVPGAIPVNTQQQSASIQPAQIQEAQQVASPQDAPPPVIDSGSPEANAILDSLK